MKLQSALLLVLLSWSLAANDSSGSTPLLSTSQRLRESTSGLDTPLRVSESFEQNLNGLVFEEEFAAASDADYYFECEVESSFIASTVSFPGGVEYTSSWGGRLLIVEAGGENNVHFYTRTGVYDTSYSLPVSNAYGIAMGTMGYYYVNNETGNDSSADMYRTNNFATWTEAPNPAGNTGRGMSFDGAWTDRIFEAKDPKYIVHFDPGSSSGYQFDMSNHVGGSWIAGVATCSAGAVFPDLGYSGTAVVVCARGSNDLWLFVRENSGTWRHIGSCDMAGISSNYNQGITFCITDGKFYLANNSSGTTRIYRLDLEAGEIPDNPPTISRVNPSSSSVTITAGESINFQVSATDPDDDLDRFEWYLNGTKVAEHPASGGSDSDNWLKTFASSGSYNVEARVYDEQDNMDNLSWSVSVQDPSYPPEIFRDNPSQETISINQGESVNFQVHATDQNADLSYFQWTLDGLPMADHSVSGSYAEDNWEHSFAETGSFTVFSTIYDSESNSDDLSWTVDVSNPAPEIFPDFPEESNVFIYPGQEIAFQAHAIDENADLDHFAWYMDGSLQEETTASGGYSESSWNHTFESTGVSEVTCWIFDAGSNDDYTIWQISVNVCSISVTEPNSSTTWVPLATGTPVNWEYPAVVGNIRGFQTISGETVTIALYDAASTLVETLAESVDNTGSWVMSYPVPLAWGSGPGYQVNVTDNLGNFGWSESFTINPPVDLEGSQHALETFAFYPVSPNPSYNQLTLSFSVASDCQVHIALYDLTGRKVITLVDNEYQSGVHSVSVSDLNPGIYFCRMNAEAFTSSQRVMLLD